MVKAVTAIFGLWKVRIVVSLIISVMLCPVVARSQNQPIKMWDAELRNGVPTAVHCENWLHDGSKELCFVANGSTVSAFRLEVEGQGLKPVWQRSLTGEIRELAPPIRVNTGTGAALFVGRTSGFLSRINIADGSIYWNRDLRRFACPLEDQIVTVPTVQLWQKSNAEFRAAVTNLGFPNQDVVYAITRYGCGATTMNRIYAVPADTGNVQTFWTFNEFGTEPLDYASSACTLDYETNNLFCGTEGPAHIRPSLWAIDTTNGVATWTNDSGSIRTSPVLSSGGDRIYVAHYDGTLDAYRKTDGQLWWTQRVTQLANLLRTPTELGAPFTGTIATVDNSGIIRVIRDLGDATEFVSVPDPSGPRLTTTARPVYTSRGGGKIYVGLTNGTVHQIDAQTGLDESYVVVGTGWVNDLSIVSSSGPNCQDRLIVSAEIRDGYKLSALRIPWLFGPEAEVASLEPCVDIPNSNPVLDPIGNRSVNEGTQLRFMIDGSDADLDPLTLSAEQVPPGAAFDPVSQTFSYTPRYDVSSSQQNNFFDVLFKASDGYGGVASETVRITVINVNRPPQADAGPDLTLNMTGKSGADVMLDGSASSDPDNDSLTFTWRGDFAQGGGTVTGVNPIISLTPGPHDVELAIDDGYGGASRDFVHIQVNATVEGLLNPMAPLVPLGDSIIWPDKAFKLRRTLSMKLRLLAGNTLLGANDIAPPQLLGIVRLGDSIELQTFDPGTTDVVETGSAFRYADGLWIYELSTKELTKGTYAAVVLTPDGRRWSAGFMLR